jgi:hypothetical protein
MRKFSNLYKCFHLIFIFALLNKCMLPVFHFISIHNRISKSNHMVHIHIFLFLHFDTFLHVLFNYKTDIIFPCTQVIHCTLSANMISLRIKFYLDTCTYTCMCLETNGIVESIAGCRDTCNRWILSSQLLFKI